MESNTLIMFFLSCSVCLWCHWQILFVPCRDGGIKESRIGFLDPESPCLYKESNVEERELIRPVQRSRWSYYEKETNKILACS